jgi:hypothetical protein
MMGLPATGREWRQSGSRVGEIHRIDNAGAAGKGSEKGVTADNVCGVERIVAEDILWTCIIMFIELTCLSVLQNRSCNIKERSNSLSARAIRSSDGSF